jgi:aspartate-semialdehyde dehydrogenase
VLGATGAVGREMWRGLEASALPIATATAYGTDRSAGTRLDFRGTEATCRALTDATFAPADLVLASAGAAASRRWTPRFTEAGGVVVDNSSAFRADPASPLVVPEVNGELLQPGVRVVANPNCSTIQMVVALAPLHRAWGLTSVRVATYQSVSGAGARAVEELLEGSRATLAGEAPAASVFPHPIAFNVLPQIGPFEDSGESLEEAKMRRETRRILDLPDLAVSATCVRVPVVRGHSEAVWATFERTPDARIARERLSAAGVVILDEPAASVYPLPRQAAGSPDVFAGRVRPDPADPRGLVLWVVSDNLLKGAATNALQIADLLHRRGALGRCGRPV